MFLPALWPFPLNLFSSFYSDRGSHYWHTPEAGGKVDKKHLTQFGMALQRLASR